MEFFSLARTGDSKFVNHGSLTARYVRLFKWRLQFGGTVTSMRERPKGLEDENRRLKKMYAEKRVKSELLRGALRESGTAVSSR